MEHSWEGEQEQPPGAATATSLDQTRLRPPPPLTHEDNRAFLEMLREKKERYGRRAPICNCPAVSIMRVA